MIKIKWFNKDEEKPTLSIKVEGSIEVKSPSYDSYEEYLKNKKKAALEQVVMDYVHNLLPNPYNSAGVLAGALNYGQYRSGFNQAKLDLVKAIMKEIEID